MVLHSVSTRLSARRKLRSCSSSGIRRKRGRTFASTAFPSRKALPSSEIHVPAFTTILIILSANTVRSSSVFRREDSYSWYPSPSGRNLFGSSMFEGSTPRNVTSMKKTPDKRSRLSAKQATTPGRGRGPLPSDELRPHYDLDYSKSKPNRFAARFNQTAIVVVLDPDVADVFQSAEAVNTFLRSAISAMPVAEPRKRKRAS